MWSIGNRSVSRIYRQTWRKTTKNSHVNLQSNTQLCSSTPLSTSASSRPRSSSWNSVIFAATVATTSIICSLSSVNAESSSKPFSSTPEAAALLAVEEVLQDLYRILPSDRIEEDVAEREARSKPWNSYHTSSVIPRAILSPETLEEVSEIVKCCYQKGVPIMALGGGTSLEGQILTTVTSGLVLDTRRMTAVKDFHPEDLDVTVQAGLGYLELNDWLRPHGLWFPLDPGPGAVVGGMVGCRCSGSTALRYGSMRENVLSLTAVLSDGRIVKTGTRARKSSAGYDLTRLLVGAEGTLAIVVEATLKVHPIPKHVRALRVSFPGGLADASRAARACLVEGLSLGRCELLDDAMIRVVNSVQTGKHLVAPSAQTVENAKASGKLDTDGKLDDVLGPWPEETTLLIEVTGISDAAAEEQAASTLAVMHRHGASFAKSFSSADAMTELWKIRKECLWTAMAQYPGRDLMITDVCVPLSQLATLIGDTKRRLDESGLPAPIVAHAGDGNFHVFLFFRKDDPEESAKAKSLASEMATRAIELGGTCTGEHGVGVGKKEFLVEESGENAIEMMKTIKTSLDPRLILNPHKILDLPGPVPRPTGSTGCCSHHHSTGCPHKQKSACPPPS